MEEKKPLKVDICDHIALLWLQKSTLSPQVATVSAG